MAPELFNFIWFLCNQATIGIFNYAGFGFDPLYERPAFPEKFKWIPLIFFYTSHFLFFILFLYTSYLFTCYFSEFLILLQILRRWILDHFLSNFTSLFCNVYTFVIKPRLLFSLWFFLKQRGRLFTASFMTIQPFSVSDSVSGL